MTVTAIGPLLDQDGLASAKDIKQGEHGPVLTRSAWSTPAELVRRTQGARIPIDLSHDGIERGQVVDLQIRGRHLWCIAHLNSAPPEWLGPWYWSGQINARVRDGGDAVLEAVALTPHPRGLGIKSHPLRFYDGDLKWRRSIPERWQVDGQEREMLTRAAQHLFHRDRGPIVVDNPPELPGNHPAEIAQALEDEFWQHRPLMYRPSRIIAVR